MADQVNIHSVCVHVSASCLCSVVWLFNHYIFRHNYPHYWLKSPYSFTFNQHNVKLAVMLSNLGPGLFTGSKPSLSKSLCPYPFVITGTNATNWLSTINLQISSFVLSLSPSALSILNTLCPSKHKKMIVLSVMLLNCPLQVSSISV